MLKTIEEVNKFVKAVAGKEVEKVNRNGGVVFVGGMAVGDAQKGGPNVTHKDPTFVVITNDEQIKYYRVLNGFKPSTHFDYSGHRWRIKGDK